MSLLRLDFGAPGEPAPVVHDRAATRRGVNAETRARVDYRTVEEVYFDFGDGVIKVRYRFFERGTGVERE